MQHPFSILLLPLAFLQSWALAQSIFSCTSSTESIGSCCVAYVDSGTSNPLSTGLNCIEATAISGGELECPALGGETGEEALETSCCTSFFFESEEPITSFATGVTMLLSTTSIKSHTKLVTEGNTESGYTAEG